MSTDTARIPDTDGLGSDDSDSNYTDSNLPSADEDDDIIYDELIRRIDSWREPQVDLFSFVKKWVEADEEDRHQHLNDLLERIKFSHMTLTELKQIQSSEMYRNSSGAWCVLVDKTVASIMSADAARVEDINSRVSDTESIYSESNLPSADEDDDPKHISYDKLILLMDSWRESEVDLFFFVKKWIEADDEEREPHISDVMERVRFCLMTLEELKQIQSSKIYGKGCASWRVLVDKAIAYHKLPINLKILKESEQNTVRGKPTPTCIMDTMEHDEYGSLRDIFLHLYTLDDDMNWYTTDIPQPFPPWHMEDSVVVNNFLIGTTGDSSKRGQDFYVFDPRTLDYSTLLTSCGKCLEECSLVHHQGCLYLIGGSPSSHKGSANGTVMKYELETNRWSHFVNLPKLDSYKLACIFQDCIYVSDGHNVECLNLLTKKWKRRAPLLDEKPHSYKSYLLCVMKVHGQECLCAVSENFELEYYNASTNTWSWLNCSYSQKLDYPIGFGENMIANGNTVLFYDHHALGRWDNGGHHGVCLLLTYPEEGNNVAVKRLDEHFYPYPRPGDGQPVLMALGVALTIPAHKVDVSENKEPDEWYDDDDSDVSEDSNETGSDDAET